MDHGSGPNNIPLLYPPSPPSRGSVVVLDPMVVMAGLLDHDDLLPLPAPHVAPLLDDHHLTRLLIVVAALLHHHHLGLVMAGLALDVNDTAGCSVAAATATVAWSWRPVSLGGRTVRARGRSRLSRRRPVRAGRSVLPGRGCSVLPRRWAVLAGRRSVLRGRRSVLPRGCPVLPRRRSVLPGWRSVLPRGCPVLRCTICLLWGGTILPWRRRSIARWGSVAGGRGGAVLGGHRWRTGGAIGLGLQGGSAIVR